ncbi:hypothetical protein DWUX_2676 [Desulfovibrio diazotrophicus]|nr:hypothetical protein DWUX_2676 [Desulfovibrio diazotrophicus]
MPDGFLPRAATAKNQPEDKCPFGPASRKARGASIIGLY